MGTRSLDALPGRLSALGAVLRPLGDSLGALFV